MIGAHLDRITLERLNAARGPIVLALSGGGDSVALMHALADTMGAARVHAVVVDHALRIGSSEDARVALGFAQALGLAAEVVTLTWSDGEKRSQETARRARYIALCAVARRVGAEVIATAHTADDQVETVLMRAATGSSWRGLAGMAAWAPAPVWPEGRGLALARPLLGARRSDLRAALKGRGAVWIEDPANVNEAYARVRARKRLAELEAAGFEPMRLADLAAQLRPLAQLVDAEAARLIARAVRFAGGHAVVASADWSASLEARRRALSVLIAAAAGAEREPEPAPLARLEARFSEAAFRGASLGGARLTRKDGRVRIGRDPGALCGRADGAPGVAPLSLLARIETVWDGRLSLVASEAGWMVRAGARGPQLARAEEALTLADAARSGLVAHSWLLEAHVAHRLGDKFTLTPSGSAARDAAKFTEP